jgi:hypothetical protein
MLSPSVSPICGLSAVGSFAGIDDDSKAAAALMIADKVERPPTCHPRRRRSARN